MDPKIRKAVKGLNKEVKALNKEIKRLPEPHRTRILSHVSDVRRAAGTLIQKLGKQLYTQASDDPPWCGDLFGDLQQFFDL